MKKYLKLITLIIIAFTTSCSKDSSSQEDQLPTGENTAYYYLDGQLIIPKSYTAGVSQVKAIYAGDCIPASEGFNFDLNNLGLGIRIHLLNKSQSGTFLLNGNNFSPCGNSINICHFEQQDANHIWHYYMTDNNSGIVKIDYVSTDGKKLNGTFQMDVFSTTGEVKHITNGHFNINLDTL